MVKKDNQYTLYSLLTFESILNNEWFDKITFNNNFDLDKENSFGYNENHYNRENKLILDKSKSLYGNIMLYKKDKISFLVEDNIFLEPKYSKIKESRVNYEVWEYSDWEGLGWTVDKTLLWEMYEGNNIYVLVQYYDKKDNSTFASYSYEINSEYFDSIDGENYYYISKMPMKKIDVRNEDGWYKIYGKIDGKYIWLYSQKGGNNDENIYVYKEEDTNNNIDNRFIIILLITILIILFGSTLLIKKKYKKKNKINL